MNDFESERAAKAARFRQLAEKHENIETGRHFAARTSPVNTVPEHVKRFVQTHLESLHDLRRRFDSVLALEKTLGAGGRYVWEVWNQDSIQRQLSNAQNGLNYFRSLARDNGIEPEPLISTFGGEPSFADCEHIADKFNS